MNSRQAPPSPAALSKGGLCARFERDGTRCHRPTRRADGWCGSCAGFLRPQKPAQPQPAGPSRQYQPLPTTEILPLTSEEAYDPQIHITRSAIDQFRARHGGDAPAAEAEIRSLLENLICVGKHRRFENGTWQLRDKAFGLLLSSDTERVIGYATLHRERTYAQVQTGVSSRSRGRGRGRSKEKGWVRELQADLPLRLTSLVLRRFARDVLGTEFTPSTGAEVVGVAHARAARVRPDGPPLGTERRRVTDKDGLEWVFAYEPGGRPVVVHLSWESGREPETAARAEGGR